jgi:hypothetical protein
VVILTWKFARSAARASSLHCPLVRNMAVRSEETIVQIAGHFPPPPSRSTNRSRSNNEDTLRLTDVREGNSIAWILMLAQASIKAFDTFILRECDHEKLYEWWNFRKECSDEQISKRVIEN